MAVSGTNLSRTGWALTVLAGVSTWFIAPHASDDLDAVIGTDFPRALLGLVSLVQLAIGVWVVVVVGLAQLVGSTAILRAVAPRLLRDMLFAGAVGALAVAPAQADRGGASPRDHAAVGVTSHELAGLPYPDRPSSATPPAAVRRRHTGVVIVRPGDTLWAISRRSLPAGASDAEIARSCAAWYAANRTVIGDDPDLIIPEQHLHPPIKEHS